jgi:hypothetical protein
MLAIQPGATFRRNEDCQECTHPLSAHEDFSPTLGLNSFPAVQLQLLTGPQTCLKAYRPILQRPTSL